VLVMHASSFCMLASFPQTLSRAVCVTVVCVCSRFAVGGQTLIGLSAPQDLGIAVLIISLLS